MNRHQQRWQESCLLVIFAAASCNKIQPVQKIERTPHPVDFSYRIERPDITQSTQDFPAISFQAFDEVTVRAGGCVNTPGNHTYRYVDPIGRASASSAHGMISIPGATAGFENIGGVIARSPIHVRKIPAAAKQPLFLRLAYDAPDPNNDYNVSGGEFDQCAGQGPAWVEVDVTHHPSLPELRCPEKPMDLHWTELDPNLLPLNPIWGQQCTHGLAPTPAMSLCDNFTANPESPTVWSPSCTSHLLTANYCYRPPWPFCSPDFPLPANTLRGHANWAFATLTGKLRYVNHLGGIAGDDDFSFDLLSEQRLVTPRNHAYHGVRALILEFNKSETVDRFDVSSRSFWARLRDLDESGRAALIFDRPAQVIGLIGIDAVHGFSELHPVIGIAIQYRQYGRDDADSWAIFARGSGNEGGCSGSAVSCGPLRRLGGPARIESGLSEIRFMLPRNYNPASYRLRDFSNVTVDTSYTNQTLLTVPLLLGKEVVSGEIDISPSAPPAISQRLTARP